MKKLLNSLIAKHDHELRVWCIEQIDSREYTLEARIGGAQKLYDWVLNQEPSAGTMTHDKQSLSNAEGPGIFSIRRTRCCEPGCTGERLEVRKISPDDAV